MATSGADAGQELFLSLPGGVDSVKSARSAVTAFAATAVSGARTEQLALVVSEVVTNAVVHGSADGPIEVVARMRDERVRVEVTDSGPGISPRPGATRSSLGGGFGLFLVEQLTRRWGYVRQRNTTRVWFELDLA